MDGAVVAVIDDDEAILTGLSSLLRSEGYQARLYTSAEAFLVDSEKHLPVCVLTDVQMTKMNGLELQAALKHLHPELPVIFMTAFPEDAIRIRAMSAGAHEFFHKPFDVEDILRAVKTAIGA